MKSSVGLRKYIIPSLLLTWELMMDQMLSRCLTGKTRIIMKGIKSDGGSEGVVLATRDMNSEPRIEFFRWWDTIVPTLKNTGRFKLRQPVDWDAVCRLREAAPRGIDPVYVEFLERFGECRLVRELGYYKLGVGSPKEDRDDELGSGFVVGYTETGAIGRWASCSSEVGLCFRSVKGGRPRALDFATWFRSEFEKIQSSFSKTAWEALVRAARPFSKSELRIVKARALFRWRQVDEGHDDRLVFYVENHSELYLPYLSIGITWGDGSVGGVWLDVSGVAPGKESRVEKLLGSGRSAIGAKAFEKGCPEPGMQDRYWEFKKRARKRDER